MGDAKYVRSTRAERRDAVRVQILSSEIKRRANKNNATVSFQSEPMRKYDVLPTGQIVRIR